MLLVTEQFPCYMVSVTRVATETVAKGDDWLEKEFMVLWTMVHLI